MKRGSARTLTFITGPLCALALAVPAGAATARPAAAPHRAAPAAATSLAGYFSSALPDSDTSYDSTGGKVTVTSSSTGVFTVTFAGLGGITGGHVEVTQQGRSDTCSVVGWAPNGGDLEVAINCYDLTGSPGNTAFSLIVTQPKSPNGILAYDWVQHPKTPGTLTGKYQFNSTGHTNTLKRLGTGRYEVTMHGTGPNTGTGTVKVSAADDMPGDCLLKSWAGVNGNIVSDVDCYDTGNALQDRPFLIDYARDNNLMGRNGLIDANAFATKAGTALYAPHIQYDSTKGARVSSLLLRQGQYVPLFIGSGSRTDPSNGGGGNVQVTAVNSGYVHCFAEDWVQEFSPYADVVCEDNHSHPVNSQYTVQWVTR
jgi:hypothetical protein